MDNEKYLLLELLMRDIRMNWGAKKILGLVYYDTVKKRKKRAMQLAEELVEIAIVGRLFMLKPNDDGRWLRANYKDGGYENMEHLHGYKKNPEMGNRYNYEHLGPQVILEASKYMDIFYYLYHD